MSRSKERRLPREFQEINNSCLSVQEIRDSALVIQAGKGINYGEALDFVLNAHNKFLEKRKELDK